MEITTSNFNDALTRGDTYILRITVRKRSGSPKDLSGATARYTIRAFDENGPIVIQKMVGDGIQITDTTNGILDITVLPAETATLVPRKAYVYDCEVTIAGEVCTVQAGNLAVIADVSRF